MLFRPFLDWSLVKKIISAKDPVKKKTWLLLSLVSNLGLLSYFKYGEFLSENFQHIIRLLGVDYHAPDLDIVLPVGISFYTFQTLSYTIDAYRGHVKERARLLDFSLYVAFFPQLVAGPIVRSHDFLPQCQNLKRFDSSAIGWGVYLLVCGLFAKVVLSDVMLAPFVDEVYRQPLKAGLVEAWAAVFAFSGQIFFDFSGYSLCAIGVAYAMGFSLPRNFNSPYAATSFSEFWHRWHISLSTWLRDYLYIPLGGSRNGVGRTVSSLMITMLLGGLWHGASWQFILWGGLHGAYLLIERSALYFFRGKTLSSELLELTRALFVFILISLTWIFFRASDMSSVYGMFHALFHFNENSLVIFNLAEKVRNIAVLIFLLFAFHWYSRKSSFLQVVDEFPAWLKAISLVLMMLAITLISRDDERAFIYFQF